MKYLSIRFLQAIAVLAILFASGYVYAVIAKQVKFNTLPDYFNIGLAGFDLLFVVAGFVVSQQFRHYYGATDATRFLGNRFVRINLLFYVTCLLSYGLSLLQERLANGGIFFNKDEVIQRSIDSIILIPATDAQFLYNPFSPITWALAFLWLAYLLYTISILLSTNRKMVVMAVLIAILSGLQLFLQPVDLRLTFLLNPILLEFLLGMMVFSIVNNSKAPRHTVGYLLVMLSLGWLIALFWLNDPNMGHPGNILAGVLSFKRLLYWGVPSATLVGGIVLLEQSGQLLSLWRQRIFQLLGRASYPIFLTVGLMGPIMQLLQPIISTQLPVFVLVLIYMLIALLIGLGIYQLLRHLMPSANQPGDRVYLEHRTSLSKS